MNLLELAKQGDVKAIAALISHSLQPKRITIVKAALKDGCFQIMLEAAQVPDQQSLVAFVRKGMTSLGAESIKTVKVYGRQTGEEFPAWSEEIKLKAHIDSTLSNANGVMHKTFSLQPIVHTQTLTKKQKNKKIQPQYHKNQIIAIASSFVFILLFSSFVGLIFWFRSAQNVILVEAQTLEAKVEDANSSSDLTILKATQLQLKQVVAVLDKAPNPPLPGSIYPRVQAEKHKIITRLGAVEQSIKLVEQLQPEVRLVIDEFSAVSSRLEVGMNYRKYSEQVGDLKVALDRFTRQTGANSHPVYKSLKAAFEDYNFALEMWRYYIESDETNDFFPASSSYGTVVIAEYQVEPNEILGEEYIYLDTALSMVWKRASNHLEVARGGSLIPEMDTAVKAPSL